MKKLEIGEALFEARLRKYVETAEIEIVTRAVVRITPEGYWIAREGREGVARIIAANKIRDWARWIGKKNRRHCRTKAEAIAAFRHRSRRRVRILQFQLDRTRAGLNASDPLI